jgi:predicted RNase H-like nuclease (RuvC/YqgF family)
MNKSYLIVPLVLLAVFSFVYTGARKEMKEKEESRLAQKAAAAKAEADRKKVIEEKSTADAIKRQEERAIADKAKEDKKEKDYLDAMAALKREADDYSTQVAKLTKEAADLEADILKTRNDKERLTREALELSKQVELAKINRRTSELEIQRMIEMVSKKLSESSFTALPPPPPPLK